MEDVGWCKEHPRHVERSIALPDQTRALSGGEVVLVGVLGVQCTSGRVRARG